MEETPKSFANDVYALVAQIPRGRVMTYGQIAALVGSPRASRQVGQVAHWGPADLPWQRVVNKQGGLAGGYTTGGRSAHKTDLEADGVEVGDDYVVDVDALLWWPEGEEPAKAEDAPKTLSMDFGIEDLEDHE